MPTPCWFWTRPALSRKGSKSVGVQRQYSGTAGRIENCQIGVFLGYASRHGHALIDRALYLPEVWANDPARRHAAGVPAETVFATKPQLGRQMLARAFAAGVPCRWVTGDSVYGADYALRRSIEKSGRGYVLAVTSRQRLGFKTVADWLEDVPADGWQRLSAGEGAKGPRLYDWAWLPYGSDAAERLAEGAADPPQAGAAGGVHLLPDAGARGGRLIRSGSGGGHKVDHRGVL